MRLLFLLFTLPFALAAQIPAGYYASAQGLKGQALRQQLHQIIKNHTVLSYSTLWTVFPQSDQKPNGKVWDIYSFNPSGPQPYEYTFGLNQCGSYNAEGQCYNREHSWPQSWFNSVAGPYSDLFHIYPTDGKVNNQRSNFPFAKVGTASWTSMNGSKVGNSVSPGYSATVFEPIDEFKGDLARSYFYMTTRYYSEDAGWASSPATNKAEILPWQLNVLLQWHLSDPVSAKEIARNDSIYKFQNNRNPFIDHPDFADSIWLSIAGLKERMNASGLRIYPQPAETVVYISTGWNGEIALRIRSAGGAVLAEKTLAGAEPIDCSELPAGVYFLEFEFNSAVIRQKLIKL